MTKLLGSFSTTRTSEIYSPNSSYSLSDWEEADSWEKFRDVEEYVSYGTCESEDSDYQPELQCLTSAKALGVLQSRDSDNDLQLAAELGKKLLERTHKMARKLSVQLTTIQDQSEEIKHLTRQNKVFREDRENSFTTCALLEEHIVELETSNGVLRKANANNETRILELKECLESLQLKYELLARSVCHCNKTEKNSLIYEDELELANYIFNPYLNKSSVLDFKSETGDDYPENQNSSERKCFDSYSKLSINPRASNQDTLLMLEDNTIDNNTSQWTSEKKPTNTGLIKPPEDAHIQVLKNPTKQLINPTDPKFPKTATYKTCVTKKVENVSHEVINCNINLFSKPLETNSRTKWLTRPWQHFLFLPYDDKSSIQCISEHLKKHMSCQMKSKCHWLDQWLFFLVILNSLATLATAIYQRIF